MKILIISDAWKPQLNGVVRTYEFLCEALEQAGHETAVIGPCDFSPRMPMPGYKEIELVLFPYRRLARMIENHPPETSIHIATEGPLGRAALRYCRKHNRPFTTAFHTHFPDYIAKRVGKFLPFLAAPVRNAATRDLQNFHNRANGIMTATPSLESYLRENGFTAPLYRVTRGVDTDIFTPDGPRFFEDLPRPLALYVGRVAIEKNLEDFLAMDWPGSKIVVGDGPARAALEKKYPHAVFAGKKTGSDLAAHYRSADLFVFPSRTDTFGIVLIEAMACGLSIAGYDVTGPADIISEPHLGAVGADNLGTIAQRALATGNDPQARQARHDHARQHYTWDVAGRQFISAIENAEEKTPGA